MATEEHTGTLCNFPASVNYPRDIKLNVLKVVKKAHGDKTLTDPYKLQWAKKSGYLLTV